MDKKYMGPMRYSGTCMKACSSGVWVQFETYQCLESQLSEASARIAELEKEREWISVEDRLPDANKPVIVFYESALWKYPSQCVAINFDGTGVFKTLIGGNDVEAMYWQEKPEDPKPA